MSEVVESGAEVGKGGNKHRKPVKAPYDFGISQQRRREELLDSQQKRRDELLEKIRQLESESCSDSEFEEDEDFVKVVRQRKLEGVPEEPVEETEELMDTTGERKGKRRGPRKWPNKQRVAPCTVMMSEWLNEKPEDFEENWVGVFCPIGKRCIVVTSRKKTYVFSRRHEYMGVFQSMLPGGRKLTSRDPEANRQKGVTILDCIWSETEEVFYVLDLICWNSISCNNCDKAYRQYFMVSKFEENESLLSRSSSNPFCFLPLPTFSCEQIADVMMTTLPIFKGKVDGVIFFHKDSFYFNTVNPLCLWIYLTDIEEKLQVPVAPELLEYQEQHRKPRMPLKRITGRDNKLKEMDVEAATN